jgi:O-antigen/teichoic acid export membrane protein
LELQELKRKASSAVFWNLSGTLLKHGVTFVISIFLARLLTPEDFGLVGMATVFIAVTQSFTDFGMTSGLIQKKDPTEVQYNTVFFINVGISLVLMFLAIIFSGYISNYYDNPQVGSIARFVSYSFVLNAINGVQLAQLTKALANKVKTLSSLYSALATGVVGIFLAYLGYGVWSLVYATLVGSIVSTIYIWRNSSWRPKALFDFAEVKPLLNFGSKMFASGLLDTIYSKLDVLIIGKMFSPATLGYYFRSVSLNQLVTKYTSGALQGVFFPVVSHLQDDREAQLRVISKSLHVISFLTFFLMGFLYLNATEIFVILFTEKWIAAVDYFKIMVLYSYAYPVSVILVNVLFGNGYSGKFLKLEIWKKVVGALSFVIGFYFGIEGFLWGSVVTSSIAVLINMVYVRKVVEWPVVVQIKTVFSYALFSILVTVGLVYYFKILNLNLWYSFFLKTLSFALFYTLLAAIFRSLGYLHVRNFLLDSLGKKLTSFNN